MHAFPAPRWTVDVAVQAATWGFDGVLLRGSEMLVADLFVELALAAAATAAYD